MLVHNHTARLWEGRSGALLATLEGHTDNIWMAAFSPDGSRVVTAADDHTARLWDGRSGATLTCFFRHSDGSGSGVSSLSERR